ncbi:hypothetical protein DFH28DRAFT_998030 [Melampsora americana]|nr:hypothetical protein DFH28DRAFT_998030 [Melampsora americana]
MALDLSGHIELWLPALVWVNSDVKAFGDGNWTFDNRPLQTPYSRCSTPNPTPRATPLSRGTLTSTRPLVNTTPRVWYSTRPASTPGPTLIAPYPLTNDPLGEEQVSRPRSDVYLYYDEPKADPEAARSEHSRWYSCLHCPAEIQIKGRPNSNLHKHCRVCPGLPEAWMNRAPGSIPPDEDPNVAALCKKELRTLLVGAIISKNLPFSIFEGTLMQEAL